jgi:hypothetical protein
MREKRGNTGKLKFDFNPLAVLEVYFQDSQKWFRVTAEYFRAFDGPRRITRPSKTIKGIKHVEMVTEDYTGPVFIWGTNNETSYTNTGVIISSPAYEQAFQNSKKRGE